MWQAVIISAGAILVGVSVAIIGGAARFTRQIKEEARALFENSRSGEPRTITEADLEGLPELVIRYLRHSGIIGKPRIDTVRLRQTGIFKQSSDSDWTPLKAEQYYTTNPHGFVWYGRIKATPLLTIAGRDKYANGEGNMLIKLASVVTVADVSADEANLMRYLNEIMWFPSAFLSKDITWESIDESSARATITDHGTTASAILHFNESGELINFVGRRLCAYTGKKETWEILVTEYGERNGMKIPVKGTGVWKLDEGDVPYMKLEITDIEYNHPALW